MCSWRLKMLNRQIGFLVSMQPTTSYIYLIKKGHIGIARKHNTVCLCHHHTVLECRDASPTRVWTERLGIMHEALQAQPTYKHHTHTCIIIRKLLTNYKLNIATEGICSHFHTSVEASNLFHPEENIHTDTYTCMHAWRCSVHITMYMSSI